MVAPERQHTSPIDQVTNPNRRKWGRRGAVAGLAASAALLAACSSPAEGQPTPAPTETTTAVETPTPEVTEPTEQEPGVYVNDFVRKLYETSNYPTPGNNQYIFDNLELWANPENAAYTASSVQRVGLGSNGNEVYFNSTPEKTAQDLHIEAIRESLVVTNASELESLGAETDEHQAIVRAHGEQIAKALNDHLIGLPYFNGGWERDLRDELEESNVESPLNQQVYFEDMRLALSGGNMLGNSDTYLTHIEDLAADNYALVDYAQSLGIEGSTSLVVKTDNAGDKLIKSVGTDQAHAVSIVLGIEEAGDLKTELPAFENVAVPLTIVYDIAEVDGKDVIQITEIAEASHPEHWDYIEERGQGWYWNMQ